MEINKIYQGDCLDLMKQIDDKSIDLILCDLPYGTTACKWDEIIPFEPLWVQYKRIIKDNGAIVLTSSQPFTSKLVMSNLKMFKYELIWEKTKASNFMLANKRLLSYHEDILIFYKLQPLFNPIKWIGEKNHQTKVGKYKHELLGLNSVEQKINTSKLHSPKSVIKINSVPSNHIKHPTQKPVALFEYLIKTYTNKGDLVLDNCIGSGTTAIAAINTGRQFIGIEKDAHYCDIARQRIADALAQPKLI